MKLEKISKIRLDLAKDLTELQTCVSDYLEDSSPIQSAINDLYKSSGSPIWNYAMDELSINIQLEKGQFRHIRPAKIPYGSNLRIFFSSQVEGNCAIWEGQDEESPFNELALRFKIIHDSGNHQSAFHLDLFNPTAASTHLNASQAHPSYHLQIKPNIDNDDPFDYGQVIEMDTPRFAHPPMEIILGLDFIFSNFAPSSFEKLHNNGTYLNLLRKYQKAIWQPYYKRISNFWESTIAPNIDNWHPQGLLPTLVERK